ncbi:MAG: hypothetical protein AAFQ68_08235 [Bacteroidota bacterium]
MNQLSTYYETYSDEKLLEVLYHKEDYKAEVIEIVESILAKRNIQPDTAARVQETLDQQRETQDAKAEEPLSRAEKFLFMLVPFLGLLVFIYLQLRYHEKGYKKKAGQSLTYSLIPIGIILLISLYQTFMTSSIVW